MQKSSLRHRSQRILKCASAYVGVLLDSVAETVCALLARRNHLQLPSIQIGAYVSAGFVCLPLEIRFM